MEEKIICVISIVRDLTDGTLLVVREKNIEALLHASRQREAFPMALKQIGESNVQCAMRVTREKTGIVIKNPVEVGRVKLDMADPYDILFFLSNSCHV